MSWSCSDSGWSSCQQMSCILGLVSVLPVPRSCGHVAPHPMLEAWLDAAEAILTASLTRQIHEDALTADAYSHKHGRNRRICLGR